MKENNSNERTEILPPKDDLVFKLLFGDERNIDILRDFLIAVLDLPEESLEVITISDPHLLRIHKMDKLGILDVKIKTPTGMVINVEIQVTEMKFLIDRIEWYNAKMLASQMKKRGKYKDVGQAITILITTFPLFSQDTVYHHRFVRYDIANKIQLSDTTIIHTLELPKLTAESDGSQLWDWMYFLSAGKREEFEMVAERNEKINQAYGRLEVLSKDERNYLLYEAREKERMDNQTREDSAREEGIKEGIKEGKEEGLKEGKEEGITLVKKVLRLHLENKSPKEIAKLCELPLESVQEILELTQ
jgi:predicted transposase/invertase (TIGR01784 family)